MKIELEVDLKDLTNWDAKKLLQHIRDNNLDTFEDFIWYDYIHPKNKFFDFVEMLHDSDDLGQKIVLAYNIYSYELFKEYDEEDGDDCYVRKQEYKKMIECKKRICELKPQNKTSIEFLEMINKALSN